MAKRKRRVRISVIVLAIALIAAAAGGAVLWKTLGSNSDKRNDYVKLAQPAHRNNNEEGYSPVISKTSATLFMVGDALLHDTVYNDGRTADGGWDFTRQIHRIGDIAKQYDLAYYNQETLL
jgi:poly-gamma-glutamate synthesis protein (capsule biosynthesis protein)